MRIPLSAPDIDESDIAAVTEVLRTPRLAMGPKLEEFERALADYVGVPHAVAVNSGTSALHLAMRAFGIGEGDEVIVPSFTFIAVANAVRYEKAAPVFVDIEPHTLNIDPVRIEEAITPRTRAIFAVHTFGCPADISAIHDVARQHGLVLIEDASEALGATHKGAMAGSFGDASVFAFYPNKQITTGEGGALVTSDPRIAAHARRLRNQGRDDSSDWLNHVELGYNYRISELNCALGIAQLRRVETTLRRRGKVARMYDERLRENGDLILPPLSVASGTISWFVYVVRLPQQFTREHRDFIFRELTTRGIGCGRYFAPIHLQPAYKEVERRHDLAVTEYVADRTLALPFFNAISEEQIDSVCNALQHAMKRVNTGFTFAR